MCNEEDTDGRQEEEKKTGREERRMGGKGRGKLSLLPPPSPEKKDAMDTPLSAGQAIRIKKLLHVLFRVLFTS